MPRTASMAVPEKATSGAWPSTVSSWMTSAECRWPVGLNEPLPEKEIWAIYRAAYKEEPFMRLVKEASGVHRYPEPKVLSGSNWCDVGFERDPNSNRIVVMAALDNLMKGAAGGAVQAFNIRCGFPETTALDFAGLHPI